MPGSPGTQHWLLQVPGWSTGYHNWAAKLLINSAGNPPSCLLQPASLMHISSLFLVLKERAHSVLRLKHRSLSITACYTPAPDAALQLFCHIWCPESPSSASEGGYGKLPGTLIFPWTQVEAITPNLTTWNVSSSALTQPLLFLWVSAVGFSAREQTGRGSRQQPSPFWQRHAEML